MQFYTIQEASKKLGVTEQKLYYEIEAGRLKFNVVANRKVIMADDFTQLKKKFLYQRILLTPKQYCQKHNMSRSKFDYRRATGRIETVKVNGKIFVKEGGSEVQKRID